MAAQVVEERERRATVLTLEQGKPIEEARGDIAYAAGLLDWFAPFGGVKQGGLGRQGGAVEIEEYLACKYVSLGV